MHTIKTFDAYSKTIKHIHKLPLDGPNNDIMQIHCICLQYAIIMHVTKTILCNTKTIIHVAQINVAFTFKKKTKKNKKKKKTKKNPPQV